MLRASAIDHGERAASSMFRNGGSSTHLLALVLLSRDASLPSKVVDCRVGLDVEAATERLPVEEFAWFLLMCHEAAAVHLGDADRPRVVVDPAELVPCLPHGGTVAMAACVGMRPDAPRRRKPADAAAW